MDTETPPTDRLLDLLTGLFEKDELTETERGVLKKISLLAERQITLASLILDIIKTVEKKHDPRRTRTNSTLH